MERTSSKFQLVLELALKQHCVFSVAQAKGLGIDHRMLNRAVTAGRLIRDLPSVYRVPGPDVSWESRLMAAQLWLGRPDGAVSHQAAAAFWHLPGFRQGLIELSTSRWKRPLPPVVVHRVGAEISGHTMTVAHIRVTNAGWTLVDLAGLIDEDHLEAAIEDAIRRDLTTVKHMRWVIGQRQGKGLKGIKALRRLLDGPGPPITESQFEIRLLQALRKASVPVPERQYEIRDGGRTIARVDFAYPWAKVAIEADSYTFHSGRDAWESDLDRRSALTAMGWLVIHVTHRQMRSGMGEVAKRVTNALAPRLG